MSETTRTVVLGVDAAWAAKNPSGIAVASTGDGRMWQLDCVASSYDEFLARAGMDSVGEIALLPNHLLRAAELFGGGGLRVVAYDMPLATTPITGRRGADNEVSRVYGSRWASTHSMVNPEAVALSGAITSRFASLNFPLVTRSGIENATALIEVYPHVALIELTSAEKRLEYKVSNIQKYWKDKSPEARRRRLVEIWQTILEHLEAKISGVITLLKVPDPREPTKALKAFEDKLDAVVCAYVAIEFLQKRAIPYGDDSASIWCPSPNRCGV